MAIIAKVTTPFGEDRELYIRLNNVEASNHGAASLALFRGFLSKDAFKAGSHYVWEKWIEFTPEVSQPLWSQAYKALVTQENLEATEV